MRIPRVEVTSIPPPRLLSLPPLQTLFATICCRSLVAGRLRNKSVRCIFECPPPVCRVPSCPHCLAFASARCFLYLDSHLLATTVRLGIFYRCERFTLRLGVTVTKKNQPSYLCCIRTVFLKPKRYNFFPAASSTDGPGS